MIGIGSGLKSVDELAVELRDDPALKQRLFTPDEVAYCDAKRYPLVHLAARYAAKIALLHAMGLSDGPWLEIETRNSADGRPNLVLSGSVSRAAGHAGVQRVLLSLTHTRDHAAAFVVLES